MSESANRQSRRNRSPLIKARPRVTPGLAVLISVVFALLATPVIMSDTFLAGEPALGEPAPVTVRIPQFVGFRTSTHSFQLGRGPIVVARGDLVTESTHNLVSGVSRQTPSGMPAWLAYFAGLFLLGLLYTNHLRRSHNGALFRFQVVTLLLMVLVATIVKTSLTLTTMSMFIVPVAAAAVVTSVVVDLSAGIATGLAASLLIGLLAPFDLGAIAVLVVQALASVVLLGDGTRKSKAQIILACGFGGIASAATYASFYYLSVHEWPFGELSAPLHSAMVAAGAGGLVSGAVAILVQPLYAYLLGDITQNRLVVLEDLSNPLLRQIAEKSPGTWQHSLAMANMAEVAANSIGANGRLVRVGAYYHDLGKSLQSKYFIENLTRGEASPHDSLPPEVSCDAIFAHVTEGIRVGRQEGLPERVIDFMHMHHGDGLLEYFWAKCQEQGNPKNLTEEDFRYPGLPPQSRETAILAICDAVEAASRTLKNPDDRSIQSLVQRIVYGKLHLGQLDESGLTMAELRKISNSLMETIRHMFHGRIEYPWQKQEREAAPDAVSTRPATPTAQHRPNHATASQRIITEPRLDSLDAPRPYWRGRSSTAASPMEVAATERVSDDAAEKNQDAGSPVDALPPSAEKPAATSARSLQPADEQPGEGAAATAAAPSPPGNAIDADGPSTESNRVAPAVAASVAAEPAVANQQSTASESPERSPASASEHRPGSTLPGPPADPRPPVSATGAQAPAAGAGHSHDAPGNGAPLAEPGPVNDVSGPTVTPASPVSTMLPPNPKPPTKRRS